MGCGVSKRAEIAVKSDDDDQKAEVFNQLVYKDRNPLAVQLQRYFQDLQTECRYRAQGDLAGYERMKNDRRDMVVVTPTSRAAVKDGIGKEPLTMQSVYSIVELFLGYAMLTLEKSQWHGAFTYRIEKINPATGSASNAVIPPPTENMLIVTDNKLVPKDPVGSEGVLELEGNVDYPSLAGAQMLHCDTRIRFAFFLLDDASSSS